MSHNEINNKQICIVQILMNQTSYLLLDNLTLSQVGWGNAVLIDIL